MQKLFFCFLLYGTLSFAETFPSQVNLVVGGERFFNLSIDVLRSQEGFLRSMFMDENFEMAQNDRTEEGYYVLNRPPDLFRKIYKYLLSPEYFLPKSLQEAVALFHESAFYSLSQFQVHLAKWYWEEAQKDDHLVENYPREMWDILPEAAFSIIPPSNACKKTRICNSKYIRYSVDNWEESLGLSLGNLTVIISNEGREFTAFNLANFRTIGTVLFPHGVNLAQWGYSNKDREKAYRDPRVIQALADAREEAKAEALRIIKERVGYFTCSRQGSFYKITHILTGKEVQEFPEFFYTLEACFTELKTLMGEAA